MGRRPRLSGRLNVPDRYLLDTHVFLDIANPAKPPGGVVGRVLNDANAQVFLSVVTVAEVCIKAALGKLEMPQAIAADPAAGFRAACADAGFTLVPVEVEHAAMLRSLPSHHKDPFDLNLSPETRERNCLFRQSSYSSAYA